MRNARVAVTGGLGFIGSHLVRRLAEDNEVIVVCAKGELELAKRRFGDLAAETREADVRDRASVLEALRGAEVVFHTAAKARPGLLRTAEDHREVFEVNVVGTYNVLEACREGGAKLVFPSTREVYGEPLYSPMDEEHPLKPESLYALSKLVGEQYCRAFHRTYGLGVVVLRLTNVYGPGDWGRVVPTFIERALVGETLRVFEDQLIDFVYVDDVVQAMVRAASAEGAEGEVINVGTGTATSLVRLAELIIELTSSGSRVAVERVGRSPVRYVLDVSKAKRVLGYELRVPLVEGLRRTIAACAR